MSTQVSNYVNKIFMSIGEPFMTSIEEGKLPLSLDNLEEVYEVMFSILKERSVTQQTLDKLKAKALLEHIELSENVEKKQYSSNILLGFGVDI